MPTLLAAFAITILLPCARSWERRRQSASKREPSANTEHAEPPEPDELLDLIDEGVLILDDSLTPLKANRAARDLLGTGQALPSALPSSELTSIARRVLVDGRPVENVVGLAGPPRTNVKVRAFHQAGGARAVLVLRDISDDQRSQRVRRQFVMHASHELKTPIAAIQLLAEAVSDAAEGDPSQARRFAQNLLQEAQRLNLLVTDLLDLSRLEDPSTIANSLADLSAVAAAEYDQARAAAAAKGITMESSVDDSVTVRGDEGQLALMIRNLLDNAVRYTSPQGAISLEIKEEGSEALVRVTDNGTGIPLRDQARVFERFYRVDQGRSRDQGGTGLGLAIVKHVADLHGGHVSVSSQLGEGSTFTVVLPSAGSTGDREHQAPHEVA